MAKSKKVYWKVLLITLCILAGSALFINAINNWLGPCLMVFRITASPTEMYETFTAKEKSPDVTNIEIIGGGWQGTDLWLRFECNEDTLSAIKAQGYVPVTSEDLSEVKRHFDFQSQSECFEPDHFSTPWSPGDLDTQTVYKLDNFKNSFSTRGFNYLTVNDDTGVVHIYHWGTS